MYDLGFYQFPECISVANKAREVNGDYETLAHISVFGDLCIIKNNMPVDILQEIKKQAELQAAKKEIRPRHRAHWTPPGEYCKYYWMVCGNGSMPATIKRSVSGFGWIARVVCFAGIVEKEFTDPVQAAEFVQEKLIHRYEIKNKVD